MTETTLYNYKALDTMLTDLYDPKEVGNDLDEFMNDLVNCTGREMHYSQSLVKRHYLLRMLRNIFWELKKNG